MIVLPDVRGLHPYYEELALRFAEAGVDAIAIDYFGRTAGAERRDDDFEYMTHVGQTTWDGLQTDIRVAAGTLLGEGRVSSLFTVGFCFGGRVAFLSLTMGLPELKGGIGFYGWPTGPSRNDTPAPAEVAGQMQGSLLGHLRRRRPGDLAADRRGVPGGAGGGGRGPRDRQLPGRSALLLRPQGRGVRRRIGGRVGAVLVRRSRWGASGLSVDSFGGASSAMPNAPDAAVEGANGCRRRGPRPPTRPVRSRRRGPRSSTTPRRIRRRRLSSGPRARRDDPDLARQVAVGGDGGEGGLDAGDHRHRIGEGDDGRTGPREAGAERAGVPRGLDEERQLRVRPGAVSLVEAIDGQRAQQVVATGRDPGDTERDPAQVRDRVRERHLCRQRRRASRRSEADLGDEQHRPQVARRVEPDRLDPPVDRCRHHEAAQQRRRDVVRVALDLGGKVEQVRRR